MCSWGHCRACTSYRCNRMTHMFQRIRRPIPPKQESFPITCIIFDSSSELFFALERSRLRAEPRVDSLSLSAWVACSAGRDLWGKMRARAEQARVRVKKFRNRVRCYGFARSSKAQAEKEEGDACAEARPPVFADGLVEVVGIVNGWHGGLIMAGLSHGIRLAKASEIKIDLSGNNPIGETFMQIDGDAWVQQLPHRCSKNPVSVHVTHSGRGRVCLNPKYNASSWNTPPLDKSLQRSKSSGSRRQTVPGDGRPPLAPIFNVDKGSRSSTPPPTNEHAGSPSRRGHVRSCSM
mmetsp:Transcript_32674/g.61409  ORF Transcript_32674/g.61409 Transcript_32674/m.61409 type:complete len:292 (+) Transcript_32674:717-1592(+)